MHIHQPKQQVRNLSIGEAEIAPGKNVSIPINIDEGQDLVRRLKISYDTSIFKDKRASRYNHMRYIIFRLALSNENKDGIIRTSWHTTNPLAEGGGIFAYLNLKTRKGLKSQSTKIDLVSGSLNEDEFDIILEDHELIIQPPTFQIFSVRQLPNGIALTLSEAPDLDILNIYDGKDKSIDTPDISLKDESGNLLAISAHWEGDSNELFLLSSAPLAAGDYNLSIESRADGLVSASKNELIDGNSDGLSGDSYNYEFSHTPAKHSISIGDTTRGAAQKLSLNGNHDEITGLPITLTTQASLTSIEGTIEFDPTQVHNASLSNGSDLPDDWSVTPSLKMDKLNSPLLAALASKAKDWS